MFLKADRCGYGLTAAQITTVFNDWFNIVLNFEFWTNYLLLIRLRSSFIELSNVP